MSSFSKVVWSDGLFVKPHHFQQQTRYFERLSQRYASGSEPHNFGFHQLVLNEELLTLGKVALVAASGIMPDGTVFDLPAEDVSPAVLDISGGFTANEIVYLCVPLMIDGGVETQMPEGGSAPGARMLADNLAIRDNTEQAGELAEIMISRVRPVLMLGSQDLSGYSKLAIARIVDKTGEGAIVIDKGFYPTMLSISAAPPLRRFLGELADGIEQRAGMIAARIGKPDQNGVAEVADFLLLRALNSIAPLLRHYVRMPILHPRPVYEFLLQIIGELSTFLNESKVCPDLPVYDHALPSQCWPTVTQHLRQLVTATLVANAVPIPHERKLHGYVVAPVHERELIRTAEFVLAVKANVPQERLHREFVAQSKVGSIEKIRELVGKQLPGIPLRLMPVAPRQLPYHAGYSYFALERSSPRWQHLENSDGFAFHIAGEFPELELQFWAIKG
ncbi:type VI secretion system baseplate subunit TssK [Thalassospiraceae bacterium SW-3-3]|nr:type VI secretion system baseplate subunit TssK [Thalassospiraceae bacterium SW-3-3]